MAAAITVSAIAVGTGVYLNNPFVVKMGAVVWIFEWLASPDMDSRSHQVNRKHNNSVQRRIWLSYWYLYRRFIPHRSPLSHSLLIGMPLRLLHLALPVAVICYLAAPGASIYMWELVRNNPEAALATGAQYDWFLYGAVLSNVTHFVKDGFWFPIDWIFGKSHW